MMNADDRKALEVLQTQVQCPKKFACVRGSLNDLCEGEYHADLDILVCLERVAADAQPCRFARPFACAAICTCPLRKFIARNFGRWSAESTAAIQTPRDLH